MCLWISFPIVDWGMRPISRGAHHTQTITKRKASGQTPHHKHHIVRPTAYQNRSVPFAMHTHTHVYCWYATRIAHNTHTLRVSRIRPTHHPTLECNFAKLFTFLNKTLIALLRLPSIGMCVCSCCIMKGWPKYA